VSEDSLDKKVRFNKNNLPYRRKIQGKQKTKTNYSPCTIDKFDIKDKV